MRVEGGLAAFAAATLLALSPMQMEPALATTPHPAQAAIVNRLPMLTLAASIEDVQKIRQEIAAYQKSEAGEKIQAYQEKYPAKKGDGVLIAAGEMKGTKAVLLDSTPKKKFAIIQTREMDDPEGVTFAPSAYVVKAVKK